MAGETPTSENLLEQQKVTEAKKVLKAADLPVKPDALRSTLDAATTLDAIREIVNEALKKEYEAVKGKVPPLKEKENAILSAYAILYPIQAVDDRIALTGRSAERVTQEASSIGAQELLAINKW